MKTNYEINDGANSTKYLIFSIENEDYGIDISSIVEIIGIQKITTVPEMPSYIMGIINLRGKIIPVMDLRLRFGKKFKEYNDRTCTIIVEVQDISMGLIVDNVNEVMDISDKDIVPVPDRKAGFHNRFIKNIGKVGENIKLLIDCDKIFTENEIEAIKTMSNK